MGVADLEELVVWVCMSDPVWAWKSVWSVSGRVCEADQEDFVERV